MFDLMSSGFQSLNIIENLKSYGITVTLSGLIIVFSMLALLCGIVTLLKFVAPKEKPVQQQASATKAEKALTMEDIKDDDMMAAALVATIDYHEETGENVRVVSIKEIK